MPLPPMPALVPLVTVPPAMTVSLEARTGIKKVYLCLTSIVGGMLVFVFFLRLSFVWYDLPPRGFASAGWLIPTRSHPHSNLLGFAYPAFASMRAL